MSNGPVLAVAASVAARLATVASATRGVRFLGAGKASVLVSWAEQLERSLAVAAALQGRDVGPSTPVAVIARDVRAAVTGIEAVWLAGGTVVVVPVPSPGGAASPAEVARVHERLRATACRHAVTDEECVGWLSTAALVGGTADELAAEGGIYVEPPLRSDDLAILQYTSGSTGPPAGVKISQANVLASVDAMADRLLIDPGVDVIVSWLPLYHDMGLVGSLATAMMRGSDLAIASPDTFMRSPRSWLGWISEHRGTISPGSSAAYSIASRAIGATLDLSSWRVAVNGGEPIFAEAVDEFVRAGRRVGLPSGAPFCAYGMAEASLAISFPNPGSGLEVDVVDGDLLALDGVAVPATATSPRARQLVRLGTPLPCVDVRIAGDAGSVGPRVVGEVQLRGDAVTGAYLIDDPTRFDGPWLRTGDLGYLTDEGEMVLCGRMQESICVRGRTVHPHDVERAATRCPGVRAGRVAAFGVPGATGDEIVVMVEGSQTSLTSVLSEVADAVEEDIGVRPCEVLFVERGSVPRTSSGKVERHLARARYLAGDGGKLSP